MSGTDENNVTPPTNQHKGIYRRTRNYGYYAVTTIHYDGGKLIGKADTPPQTHLSRPWSKIISRIVTIPPTTTEDDFEMKKPNAENLVYNYPIQVKGG